MYVFYLFFSFLIFTKTSATLLHFFLNLSSPSLLAMKLTDLPTDILFSLPNYLNSLDDHYSLIRTSRTLYLSCAWSKAKLPPSFAEKNGQKTLPPHRDLLLASISRPIADWAVQCQENRSTFLRVIRGEEGDVKDGLLRLGETVVKLGLEEIQAFYKAKHEVIEPLADLLYLKGLERWLEPPVFKYRSWQEIIETLYNYLIYCELFHHSIDKARALDDDPSVEGFGRADRRNWALHSMPHDDASKSIYNSRQVWNLRRLNQYMVFGPQVPNLTPHWNTSPEQERFAWLIMQHQGLATLRCMLDPTTETAQELVSDIRTRAYALKEEEFPNQLRYVGRSIAGWCSLWNDIALTG